MHRRAPGLLALTLLAAAAHAAPASKTRRYLGPRLPGQAGQPPYSDAVLIGDTLYLAGRTGEDASGKRPADAAAEARNALDAMQRTLDAAGMDMDDLVFVQVFCSDLALSAKFDAVYRTYFKKEFPARALLATGKLLSGARFEVQGIAIKR